MGKAQKNGHILIDACVLYRAIIRDFLLDLAQEKLFQPCWSDMIQAEWIRNLVLNRPDLRRENLERGATYMNIIFPDANITRFEKSISTFSLPDPGGNHVLAAAVHAKANVILTFNLKDFPADYLA